MLTVHGGDVEGDPGAKRTVDVETRTHHVADALFRRAGIIVELVALGIAIAVRGHVTVEAPVASRYLVQ